MASLLELRSMLWAIPTESRILVGSCITLRIWSVYDLMSARKDSCIRWKVKALSIFFANYSYYNIYIYICISDLFDCVFHIGVTEIRPPSPFLWGHCIIADKSLTWPGDGSKLIDILMEHRSIAYKYPSIWNDLDMLNLKMPISNVFPSSSLSNKIEPYPIPQ